MKKIEKQKYILKVMVSALNEIISKGCIDLDGKSQTEDTDKQTGYIETVIFDKPTIINWKDAGYDELRISVWWDYTPELIPERKKYALSLCNQLTPKPQANARYYRYILGACGSCYLERRTGKFIIGDENNQFFDMYVREDSERLLKNAELAEPKGYQTHGWIKE